MRHFPGLKTHHPVLKIIVFVRKTLDKISKVCFNKF